MAVTSLIHIRIGKGPFFDSRLKPLKFNNLFTPLFPVFCEGHCNRSACRTVSIANFTTIMSCTRANFIIATYRLQKRRKSRMERLSITFRSNGKPARTCTTWSIFLFTCRLLFIISTPKLVVSGNFLSIRIVLSCFYLLIFYFEKFSTWIWLLPFAVCRIREA